MVNWTSQAQRDVRRIFSYIEADSRRYAERVTSQIFETGDGLDKFMEQGRVLPELKDLNVREVFYYSYRIVYEIYQNQVYILAVIHMSRNITEDMIKRVDA